MAKDVANDIIYYLRVDRANESHLGNIRHWSNLKIAFNETQIWVKDLDYVQVNSIEVKSIPYKTVFYAKDGKLFLMNSLLPDRNILSMLWTPVDRALPVKLPGFNHNYFGISETLSVRIVPSQNEGQAVAMIVALSVLQDYLHSAPEIRLQTLKWTILNGDKAFLYGTPLLPLTGEVFWQRKQMILPAGYDFDLHILADELTNRLDAENEHIIVWNTDSTYFLIERDNLQALTLSSYRLSMRRHSLPVIHGA